MFYVKKVQNFPAARAKSDAKGKKTVNLYRFTKNFTQSINFFTQLSDEKNTVPTSAETLEPSHLAALH